jgi:hypothetical protein
MPGLGGCGWILTVLSWVLIGLTFPISLCVCLKVRCTFTTLHLVVVVVIFVIVNFIIARPILC